MAQWRWNVPLRGAVARAKGRQLVLLLVSRRADACSSPGSRAAMSPDAAVTAPGAAMTAPGAAMTAPDAAVTAPDEAVTAPDAAVTAPDAAAASPRESRDMRCLEPLSRVSRDVFRLGYEAASGEGRHVVQRYNVVLFPSLILIGPDAVEVGRVSGFPSGHIAARRLGDLMRGDGTIQRLEQQIARNPNDLELRLELLRRLVLRGDAVRATPHLRRLVALDPDDARGYASRAMLLNCDILLFRSLGDARAAQSCLFELPARFPRSKVVPRARRGVARVRSALAAAEQ
jgi:hypothetical protein